MGEIIFSFCFSHKIFEMSSYIKKKTTEKEMFITITILNENSEGILKKNWVAELDL